MRRSRAVVAERPWTVAEPLLDARAAETLVPFLPTAGATVAVLLTLARANTHPVVRHLAVVALALVPAGTFVVVALATDADPRWRWVGRPRPADAAVLLAVTLAALALAWAPLLWDEPGVVAPATWTLGVVGYLVVPFWLGHRALPTTDAVEAGMLTLLLTVVALVEAAVLVGALHPVSAAEIELLVGVGVVGPAVLAGVAARRSEMLQ